jgi:cell division transport system permease protein
VFSRQDELEIYRIVGATPGFTKTPFYIEGVLQGIIATFFTMLLLYFFVFMSKKVMPAPLVSILTWDISEIVAFAFGILGSGILFGWLGSWLALRRFLRV